MNVTAVKAYLSIFWTVSQKGDNACMQHKHEIDSEYFWKQTQLKKLKLSCDQL